MMRQLLYRPRLERLESRQRLGDMLHVLCLPSLLPSSGTANWRPECAASDPSAEVVLTASALAGGSLGANDLLIIGTTTNPLGSESAPVHGRVKHLRLGGAWLRSVLVVAGSDGAALTVPGRRVWPP